MTTHCHSTESIAWIPSSDELPDEGITVLLFSPDAAEPVWPGYFDEVSAHGYIWRTAMSDEITGVTHWAEMPFGPV